MHAHTTMYMDAAIEMCWGVYYVVSIVDPGQQGTSLCNVYTEMIDCWVQVLNWTIFEEL